MEESGFDGVVVAITDGAIGVPETKPPMVKDVIWLIESKESPPTEAWGEVIRFDE